MRLTATLAAMALVLAAPAAARQPRPAENAKARGAAAPRPAGAVEVRTWVSKTAVWVGDRVVYTIEFRRAPNVEIFLDDLAPDRLHLEGLDVVETATERDASVADRIIDRVSYTLATYNVETPTLGITAFPVRYSVRQPGQKAQEALPAGDVTVPALHLALRSTITPSGESVQIRDQRAARPLPRHVRYAETAGWTLLALSAVPVLLWALRMFQRARQARPKRVARPPLRRRRAALEEIRTADVSTPEARRTAYTRLDAWIRENVVLAGGVPAAALTPEEISAAIGDRKPADWRLDLERLLLECENAKFGAEPPADGRWPTAVDEAARLTLSRSAA